MVIKNKKDIDLFVSGFSKYAENEGDKLYFVINDTKLRGFITIMRYDGNVFSVHRKNNYFWDLYETKLNEGELYNLIWTNRKSINKSIKNKKDPKMLPIYSCRQTVAELGRQCSD